MIGIKKVKDMDTKESREAEALAYVAGYQGWADCLLRRPSKRRGGSFGC